jgi:4-amino-4-deoxy-L-arabinose transferase-like glycosyltransferase
MIIWIALLAVLLYAYAAGRMSPGRFPLDDSWIHQTYGRNLGLTGRWDYVPGVPSAGSTSPLYTVLLAIGYGLRLPYLLWTHFLGAAALALAGMIGARMADRLYPQVKRAGLYTGIALVLTWHLIWAAASGMETMLFAMLCLAVMYLAWRELPTTDEPPSTTPHFGAGVAFGMVSALLIATRPEGSLLVGITGFIMLIVRPQGSWRLFAIWAAGAVLGGMIGLMPYALLNLSLNGTLFPNTLNAKQEQASHLLAFGFFYNLGQMLEPLSPGVQFVLLPGVVAFLLDRWRKPERTTLLYVIPLLWSVAMILLFTIRLPAPYQHGRYLIPAIPSIVVIGVGGTLMLVTQRSRRMLGRVLRRSLALIVIGVLLVFVVIGANTYAVDVWRIESDMVVAADWVKNNIPPDQLLAVHDIGAIGYFAPRDLLDIAGLISPETIVYYHDPEGMLRLMQERGARWLVALPTQVAPQWLPYLCLKEDIGGGMGGMKIYEFTIAGACQ